MWNDLTERGGCADMGCLLQNWFHVLWYGAVLWCNALMQCHDAVSWWNVIVQWYGVM